MFMHVHVHVCQLQGATDGNQLNEGDSGDDDEFDRQMREKVRKRLRGEVEDDEPKLSRA